MKSISQVFTALCLFVCIASGAAALDWPILRDSVYKPLGNSYGQYQCYGDECIPFMHSGIDIMAPTGTPVYAVKSGYVKAILTTSEGADAYWRVVIGDLAGTAECEAFMYAHIDELSIPLFVSQWVEEGQYVGNVVYFPYNEFNHLHFSKIRHSGDAQSWQDNWYEWEFIGIPLDDMDELNDPDAPVFENAYGPQKFAFCGNQSADYFEIGEILSGDVDIIGRMYDFMNDYGHKITPYEIKYRIDDHPWIISVNFSSEIGPYGANMRELTQVIYQDDSICDTKADYDIREYYFNVTNSDGDSLIETSDAAYAWKTADNNNGEHIIYLRASDRAGNTTTDSMTVSIANFFTLTGTVQLSDIIPQPLGGSVVTILSSGQVDTTDASGEFLVPNVGGGSQIIEIVRSGFTSADTAVMMNQNRQLEVTLVPGEFVAGDANCDRDVNVGDAVYIINYVFKGGAAPIPYMAGNANGDGETNIADAVYLISYIFHGGPPPVEL
jgi:hypothetical protein